MKKKIITALSLVATIITGARTLSPDQALELARTQGAMRSVATDNIVLAETVSADEVPALYIFSRDSGDGFLVVAADDAMQPLVLAYGDSPCDAANIPPAMQWALDIYARNVAAAAAGKAPVEVSARAAKASIQPFLTTKWNQTSPYNQACPSLDGVLPVAGCVPIAMAQAMKHFDQPTKGTGQISNSFRYRGKTYTQTVNFGATTYQWSNMPNTLTDYSPASQKNAVATLVAHCGAASQAGYSPDGTGASDIVAANGMTVYFGYDKGMQYCRRELYTTTEWDDLVYAEIASSRPVMYAGYDEEMAGHEFLIDGYNGSGLYHVNWGWGGVSDGYFALNALNPYEQGAGGGSGSQGFNWGQSIITGIRPQQPGSDYKAMMFVQDFGTDKNTYARNSNYNVINFTGGYYNCSIADLYLEPGVSFRKIGSSEEKIIGIGSAFLQMLSGYSSLPVYMYELSGLSGTYVAKPVFRTPNGQWQDCLYDKTQCTGELIMTFTASTVTVDGDGGLAGSNVTFSNATEGSGTLSAPYTVADDSFTITANVSSPIAPYSGKIYAVFAEAAGTTSIAISDGVSVSIAAGGQQTVTFSGPFYDFKANTVYRVLLLDDNENFISGSTYFQLPRVGTLSASPITVAGTTSGSGTRSNPYIVSADELRFSTTVTCSGAPFSGSLQGLVAVAGNSQSIAETEPVAANFAADQKKYMTFTLPASLLTTGTNYRFLLVDQKINLIGSSIYFKLDPASGIADIDGDAVPARYFTPAGIEVAAPTVPGLYIRRQGSSTTKLIIR